MAIQTWQQIVGQNYNDSRPETEHEEAMQVEIAALRAVIADIGERCYGSSYLLGNDIHKMVMDSLPDLSQ